MTTTKLRTSLEGLDEFIDEQLQLWNGVGTAVAVVHKDEVVWQKATVIVTWSPNLKLPLIRCLPSVQVPKPLPQQLLLCLWIRGYWTGIPL